MSQVVAMNARVEQLSSTSNFVTVPLTCIRSSSFAHRMRPNLLEIQDESGQRRHSMPSPNRLSISFNDIRSSEQDETLRRVRSFKTTAKGMVNNGDVFSTKDSGSIVWSGCTITGDNIDLTFETKTPPQSRKRTPSTTSQDSGTGYSLSSSGAPSYFRVLVLGSPGVGRTALTNQFMSSDNKGTTDDFGKFLNTHLPTTCNCSCVCMFICFYTTLILFFC